MHRPFKSRVQHNMLLIVNAQLCDLSSIVVHFINQDSGKKVDNIDACASVLHPSAFSKTSIKTERGAILNTGILN